MRVRSVLILVACCVYFFAAGLLLIPYCGFQHDEVVFAQPLYEHGLSFYSRHVGSGWIPMMINSYAGAFKTWIYWPILAVWHPSAYSIRVPAMAIAALAMVLFWPIMVRAGGRRAATITTILLATDTTYLMTSAFDWGPCALQHFFLVAVMLAFIRFHETADVRVLALASFLVGLALWEKALFFWLGGGLVVGCAAVYPKQAWRHVSVKNLGIAAASFVIGAMPFIMYNVHKPNSTLEENATISTDEFANKVEAAHRTINAHSMYMYLVYDDWYKQPREPRTDMERASMELRNATGVSQTNEMMWAYGLAILLAPFTWRTRAWRPLLFSLVFCAVGWGLMLLTKNAGASVHHVILLWPVPLMFLGLAYSEASRRVPAKVSVPVLAVVVGYFAAENVLATNQYLAQLIRNGPCTYWTNALYPMSADLMQAHSGEVVGIDWGTTVPLEVLEQAEVPMSFVGVDEAAPDAVLGKMGKPAYVFLSHVKELEIFPGIDEKIDGIAAKHGFSKQVIKTYADDNGRPTFELFQYKAAGTDASGQ
ncbi:MAG TPA: glycosyltransferase family 39 protein [Bryobacteraceae bacterium]|jgi:hypothetical protein